MEINKELNVTIKAHARREVVIVKKINAVKNKGNGVLRGRSQG